MTTLEKQNNYINETIEFKGQIELAFMTFGGRLMNIRDNGLWRGVYDNYLLFLDEIDMSESSVSKLISIYKKFFVDFPIPEEKLIQCGGWSQLAEILPLVKSQSDAEYWVEQVILQDRKGLRETAREAKTGVKIEDCNHDYYEMRVCRRCGDKQKIYAQE
jgi:hypothetical protein